MQEKEHRVFFSLWHTYERADWSEEDKLLGIYSSKALAEEVLERARNKPGFIDHPDGFFIGESPVNKDGWETGFVTMYFPHDPNLPYNER